MANLRINSQYYENYSDSNTPYWKPKGGQVFEMEVEGDILMYSTDLESHLKEMVSSQSDEHNKFEYIDHEVLFIKPIKLDTKLLMNLIKTEAA